MAGLRKILDNPIKGPYSIQVGGLLWASPYSVTLSVFESSENSADSKPTQSLMAQRIAAQELGAQCDSETANQKGEGWSERV